MLAAQIIPQCQTIVPHDMKYEAVWHFKLKTSWTKVQIHELITSSEKLNMKMHLRGNSGALGWRPANMMLAFGLLAIHFSPLAFHLWLLPFGLLTLSNIHSAKMLTDWKYVMNVLPTLNFLVHHLHDITNLRL